MTNIRLDEMVEDAKLSRLSSLSMTGMHLSSLKGSKVELILPKIRGKRKINSVAVQCTNHCIFGDLFRVKIIKLIFLMWGELSVFNRSHKKVFSPKIIFKTNKQVLKHHSMKYIHVS